VSNRKEAEAAWVGWWRPRPDAAWERICEAATFASCRRDLAAVAPTCFGRALVLRAGWEPDAPPPRPGALLHHLWVRRDESQAWRRVLSGPAALLKAQHRAWRRAGWLVQETATAEHGGGEAR
jgi:hypothetical protein